MRNEIRLLKDETNHFNKILVSYEAWRNGAVEIDPWEIWYDKKYLPELIYHYLKTPEMVAMTWITSFKPYHKVGELAHRYGSSHETAQEIVQVGWRYLPPPPSMGNVSTGCYCWLYEVKSGAILKEHEMVICSRAAHLRS